MFHWICPECGEECSPSSRDCPTCYPTREQAVTRASTDTEARLEATHSSVMAAVLDPPEMDPQDEPTPVLSTPSLTLTAGQEPSLLAPPEGGDSLAHPLLALAVQVQDAHEESQSETVHAHAEPTAGLSLEGDAAGVSETDPSVSSANDAETVGESAPTLAESVAPLVGTRDTTAASAESEPELTFSEPVETASEIETAPELTFSAETVEAEAVAVECPLAAAPLAVEVDLESAGVVEEGTEAPEVSLAATDAAPALEVEEVADVAGVVEPELEPAAVDAPELTIEAAPEAAVADAVDVAVEGTPESSAVQLPELVATAEVVEEPQIASTDAHELAVDAEPESNLVDAREVAEVVETESALVDAPEVVEVVESTVADAPEVTEVVEAEFVVAHAPEVAEVVEAESALVDAPEVVEVVEPTVADAPEVTEVVEAESVVVDAPEVVEVVEPTVADAPEFTEVVEEESVVVDAPEVAEVVESAVADAPEVAEVVEADSAVVDAPEVVEVVEPAVADAPEVVEVESAVADTPEMAATAEVVPSITESQSEPAAEALADAPAEPVVQDAVSDEPAARNPEPAGVHAAHLAELAAATAALTAAATAFHKHREEEEAARRAGPGPHVNDLLAPLQATHFEAMELEKKAMLPTGETRTTIPGPALTPKLEKFQEGTLLTVLGEEEHHIKKSRAFLVQLVGGVGLFICVVTILISLIISKNGEATPAPTASATPAKTASPVVQPLLKYLEITGMRVAIDLHKNSTIQYLLVNHSAAEISDLTLLVTVRSMGSTPQQPPVCRFSVKLAALGPFESREFTAPIDSPVHTLELPDWQNLRGDLEITAQ